MDKVTIKELRDVDPFKFRNLALKTFSRFLPNFYVEKSEPFAGGYNFKSIAENEKDLIHIRQDRLLVDSVLIRKLYNFFKLEKVDRVFLITTGIVKIFDKSFLEDKPVEIIDARRLVEFLSITLGAEGLRKEWNILRERRKYSRLSLTQKPENRKVCLRADTLCQAKPDIGGFAKDISASGIRLSVVNHIPLPSLFRLELILEHFPSPIKVLAKTVWQRQICLSGRQEISGTDDEAGLLFFLIKNNDREKINEFIRIRDSDIEKKYGDSNPESDFYKKHLLEMLVKKNILKRKYLSMEERGVLMDIEKVNLRAQRFLRRMFQRKSKILDTHKTESGWEVWARVIDDYFKKLGYRDVYEKKIYIVRLDENFKVFGYTIAAESRLPQAATQYKKEKPVSMDKVAIKEVIREVIKEILPKKEADSQLLQDITKKIDKENASVDINPEALKRIAKEVASHISLIQDESKQKDEPRKETIKIQESFINPFVETKMNYNFKQLGTLTKSNSKINKQIKSFRSIKKGRKGKEKKEG